MKASLAVLALAGSAMASYGYGPKPESSSTPADPIKPTSSSVGGGYVPKPSSSTPGSPIKPSSTPGSPVLPSSSKPGYGGGKPSSSTPGSPVKPSSSSSASTPGSPVTPSSSSKPGYGGPKPSSSTPGSPVKPSSSSTPGSPVKPSSTPSVPEEDCEDDESSTPAHPITPSTTSAPPPKPTADDEDDYDCETKTWEEIITSEIIVTVTVTEGGHETPKESTTTVTSTKTNVVTVSKPKSTFATSTPAAPVVVPSGGSGGYGAPSYVPKPEYTSPASPVAPYPSYGGKPAGGYAKPSGTGSWPKSPIEVSVSGASQNRAVGGVLAVAAFFFALF